MADLRDRIAAVPHHRPAASLLLAVVGCEVVGAAGSVFTTMGLETWYPGLVRPSIAPPNWVFAPVWTGLFALMGVAAWIVWRRARDPGDRPLRLAAGLFAGQFVLNLAWSAVFFGAQSLLGGLVVIGLLWLAILATAAAFYRVDRRAGVLLVPYLAWVGFAAYLNYGFWALN